jgi:hypothetical protein
MDGRRMLLSPGQKLLQFLVHAKPARFEVLTD